MHSELLTPNDLVSGADLQRQIEVVARAGAGSLSETAHLLADMPELSWKEFRTTALLAGKLRGLGWVVDTFAQQPGLIARIGPDSSGFAPIALRMELDALPAAGTVAYTCGHNYHIGRFNVIATEGEARGNLRWFDPRTPDRVKALIQEVVTQYNQLPGITVGVDVGYQPTVVDGTLADHMATAARHVAEVVPATRTTVAEDMGKYHSVGGVPIGFVTVGFGEQDYPEGVPNPHEHHSDTFAVTAAAEADLWKAVYMLVVAGLIAVVGD